MNTDSADKPLRSTELRGSEFTEALRENLTDLKKKERKGTALVILGGTNWDVCSVHISSHFALDPGSSRSARVVSGEDHSQCMLWGGVWAC
jgi:hypothetical protein